MPKTSAGLLPYRRRDGRLEVFLVHPGGPFWARRDAGAWSVAKGEVGPGEGLLEAAQREFTEETGFVLSEPMLPLAAVRQPGGKVVHVWAAQADLDPAALRSGTFAIEWPPRSGTVREFPEVDRGAWLALPEAREKLLAAQAPLLDELRRLVDPGDDPEPPARRPGA